jgi:hypothetical protein
MSGGSYNYMCYSIESMYKDELEDKELDALLIDFVKVLHDLEWWKSDDIGEDTYRETVKKFKDKWLRKYNKELCYEFCPHKTLSNHIKLALEEIDKLEGVKNE